MSLSTKEIRKHYLREDVKEILLEATELDDCQQALITGFAGWYREKKVDGRTKEALAPFKERLYQEQIKENMGTNTRSLYWSTNFFEPSVFRKWIDKKKRKAGKVSKPGGYATTGYYRLGIDIDLLDEENLEELKQDRDVKKAICREMLEKAGGFLSDKLALWLNRKVVKSYFSGNGLYVTLDPSIVHLNCEAEKAFKICVGFDALISQLQKEFYAENPEARKYVKFDALNNSSRAWKTVLAIHKSQPFCCIPLESAEPEIDLEKASPPLGEEVIEETRKWIEPISTGGRKGGHVEKFPQGEKGKSRDKAGEIFGVRKEYTAKLGELLNKDVVDRELFGDLLDRWGDNE